MNDSTTQPKTAQTYEQGLALLRAGRAEEGIAALQGIVAEMPKAIGDVVWAYHARGQNASAQTHLARYLEHFPNDASAWSLMAQIARERNELSVATVAARRAADLKPQQASFWFDLGEILFLARRWRAARRAYHRCLKLDPQSTGSLVKRDLCTRLIGGLLCRVGYAMHLRNLNRFPNDVETWARMAQIARERNELNVAAAAAQHTVDLKPRQAGLWFDLGEILFFAGRWRTARRAYTRCLKLDPDATKAQVKRELCSMLIGVGPLRHVIHWKPVRRLLRAILSSRAIGDLIELKMGIALDDPRWQMPLAWGDAKPAAEPDPPDQAPEQFAEHFAQCQCGFWRWFRSLRLEGRVEKALEIGGHGGHIVHHFSNAGFDVKSLAGDEAALAERRRRGISGVVGDMHLIEERGGSYDLIIAAHALQQSRSPLFALWEWRRLLRPDGYLVIMARLPHDGSPDEDPRLDGHATQGVAGHIMTLTYWQLRRIFKYAGFLLIAESLEDPLAGSLESVEHVDGRRQDQPARPWNLYALLRKPGALPCDGELEKPRPTGVAVPQPNGL